MIIGLYSSGSRCGKDTVASFLVRNYGFEQRNLASPIRDLLLPLLDVLRPEISSVARREGWDETKKLFPESVDAMIALGQGGRDFIDQDIWLNACINHPYRNLVLADCRQLNEAQFIVDQGGELWKIERKGSQVRGMDGLLEDWDFAEVINNNGTIEELEETVTTVMEGKSYD